MSSSRIRAAVSSSRVEVARRNTVLTSFSRKTVSFSSGSACASESLEPSYVLRALNIDPGLSHTAIRFSLSRFTTPEEIDRTKEILPEIVNRLRSISISYKRNT